MSPRSGINFLCDLPRKYVPVDLKKKMRRVQTRLYAAAGPYYCPVCESRTRRFEPIPNFFLLNAEKNGFSFSPEDSETCNHQCYSCPFCEASDRDRLYALYFRAYLQEQKTKGAKTVVDFAPSAPLSNCLRKLIKRSRLNISYRTADLFADTADDKVDIMDMRDYEDGEFDFFICSHVLEHVADDRKALAELYRILRPGGKGVLMVPLVLTIDNIDEDPSVTDESERWRRFGQFDHVRLYSRNGFLERVRDAGFGIHQYNSSSFGPGVFNRNGITEKSVLYVVEK